ncbi:proteasome regulatory particle base subunit [Borealophlyctis nickersoniae]|nr:proteasome regulatory particle base subunit [Borealophlyctis nickersoniae]
MGTFRYLLFLLALLLGLVAARTKEGRIAVGNVAVTVSGGDGSVKSSEQLTFPAKLRTKHEAGPADKLSLALKLKDEEGKPLRVHQAFLEVANANQAGGGSSFALEATETGVYRLTLELKAQSTLDALKHLPGEHHLTLHIGSFTAQPISYPLGTAVFSFQGNPEHGKFAWDVFDPLPEIEHQFSPDAKTPPRVLSQAFTLLTLVPWIGLTAAYLSLGANVRNLFASPSHAIFGGLYLGSLVLFLLLFYLYWTKFNLFQLLGYGSLLGSATAIVGRQALVARATARTKQ